jgi:hypothetical protein
MDSQVVCSLQKDGGVAIELSADGGNNLTASKKI